VKLDGAFRASFLDVEHPYVARADNNRVDVDEDHQQEGTVKLH